LLRKKFPHVRTGLIHDVSSAHQDVEDDDMNVIYFGGKVIGAARVGTHRCLPKTLVSAGRYVIGADWRKWRRCSTKILP
jgi:hypothetical protein